MREETATLVKDFLRYLKVQRKRSALTARNYALYLGRFTRWLTETSTATLDKLTGRDIERFRSWLGRTPQHGSNRPLAQATQNYHLIALRSFLKFLREKGEHTLEPAQIKLTAASRRRVLSLSQNELERLLSAPGASNEPELIRLRDTAILALLATSGLTVSQLVALERKQAEGGSQSIVVKHAGKQHSVPLESNAHQQLTAYLTARPDHSAALFVRHDRASTTKSPPSLTPRSVQRLVEHYRRAAGLTQKVTPHTLRHAFARQLVARGTNLKTVQQTLGHQHITTTNVYRHAT